MEHPAELVYLEAGHLQEPSDSEQVHQIQCPLDPKFASIHEAY